MKESSGKLPEGTFDGGSSFGMGNFDECLSIMVPTSDESLPFQGKYCSVSIIPVTIPMKLENESVSVAAENLLGDSYVTIFEFIELLLKKSKPIIPAEIDGQFYMIFPPLHIPGMGLCLPSVCTAKEIRHAVAQLVGRFIIPTGKETAVLPVTATSEDYCYTADKPAPPFDGPAIAVM